MKTDKIVAMEGAAWLASSVVEKSRDKFIADGLAGIAFVKYSESDRRSMLGQVWDICASSELKKPAKKKK